MSMPKEPELVMKLRGGSVLGKKTILKSDHFPGCQNKRLSPQIDGAPNYRQADSLHVHGVAIPTIDGIRNVLKHIGAQIDGKGVRVLWISLREEPVIYINGRPFVLCDEEKPLSNLELTGINRDRVEQMEDRLKEDIMMEAARYGNKILVTDELPDYQIVDQWEPVSRDSVKTPLIIHMSDLLLEDNKCFHFLINGLTVISLTQVYQELHNEGYLVDYELGVSGSRFLTGSAWNLEPTLGYKFLNFWNMEPTRQNQEPRTYPVIDSGVGSNRFQRVFLLLSFLV